MTTSVSTSVKVLTLTGIICLIVPLSIFVLWWSVADQEDSHVENVARFQSFFPGYLQGRLDTAFLGIAFTLPALLISSTNLKKTDTFWNSLNKIVLILSSILLFLNLWQMM